MRATDRSFPGSISQPVAATGRRDWMDYARGIAIILVVFGHVVGGFKSTLVNGVPLKINYWLYEVFDLIYYARMPLFFIISGIYIRKSLAKRGAPTFVKYKFETIFYPYLIWGSVQLLFQYAGSSMGFSNTSRNLGDFVNLLVYPRDMDQFWFLYTLFSSTLLYAVAVEYLKLKAGSLLLLSFVAYVGFYYLPDIMFVFGLKYLAKFFFYVVLGDIVSSWILDQKKANKFSNPWLGGILLLVFVLIKFAMAGWELSEHENDFLSIQNLFLLISIFTGVALIFNVSFLLQKFKLFSWLRFIGQNSLYIYTMHVIVSGVSRALLLKLSHYQYPDIILYVVTALAIGIPILAAKMITRLNWWFFYSPVKPAVRPGYN